MMRVISFLILNALTSCTSKAPQPSPVFLQKVEAKSYLALDLPFAGFEKIRKTVEQKQGLTLQNRGEAHITVITPPEYKKMEKKVSMKEITVLAEKMDLLHSPYKLLCVGKGSLKEHDRSKSTFYVVVESDRLFQIRKAVQMLYIKKGGKAEDFNPDLFYPHVTLGFTDRDLHYEDGVIKDASSCLFSLNSNNEVIKN